MDSDGERSSGTRGSRITATVVEQLPAGLYRVKLDQGSMVTAHIAGNIDRNFIRLLVGDRVGIELSAADTGRGRIVEKIL